MRDRTAAIIVVGNEILSGKVADTNSAFLTRELRHLGVSVRRILVIPDDLEDIAETVRAYHGAFDLVFTSGGVGPTHDDVTIAGVARGLGRAVVRHPWLEQKIREFSADHADEAHLKMAEIPEGAQLLFGGSLNFPALQAENIYILPGIPELFRDKFDGIKDRFASAPFHLRVIYTRGVESALVHYLNETLVAFPLLQLGSYPKLNDPDYQVRVTLESKDRTYVDRAFDDLVARLPPGLIVRTE